MSRKSLVINVQYKAFMTVNGFLKQSQLDTSNNHYVWSYITIVAIRKLKHQMCKASHYGSKQ